MLHLVIPLCLVFRACALPPWPNILGWGNQNDLPSRSTKQAVDERFEICEPYQTLFRCRWDDLHQKYKDIFTSVKVTAQAWDNFEVWLLPEMPDWKHLRANQRSLMRQVLEFKPDGLPNILAESAEKQWDCIQQMITYGIPGLSRHHNSETARAPPVVGGLLPGVEFRSLPEQVIRLGVFPFTGSAMIASLTGQLIAGNFGMEIEYKLLTNRDAGFKALEEDDVDLIMEMHERHSYTALPSGIQNFGSHMDITGEELYITRPHPNANQPYSDQLGNLVPFWTSLQTILPLLPMMTCTSGPWSAIRSNSGVWCMKGPNVPLVTKLQPPPSNRVPVVWVRKTDSIAYARVTDELKAFINWADLDLGIQFLEPDELHRRVKLATTAGRPALFVLSTNTNIANWIEDQARRIYLPVEREHLCGTIGNWTDVGKWRCTLSSRRLMTLGGKKLAKMQFLEDFVSRIYVDDQDMLELFRSFRQHVDSMERLDTSAAVGMAAQDWIRAHQDRWRSWDNTPSVMGTFQSVGASISALCLIVAVVVAYLIGEWKCPKNLPYPDKVDRTEKMEVALEMLSGTMDTVNVLMRSVGMAAVICASDHNSEYQGIVMKHIIIGQILVQLVILWSSGYETPVCTPSIEILPILKVVLDDLEEGMVGCSTEALMVTFLACSMLINLLSGLLCSAIGMMQIGWVLRYIPYSVHAGVQAALGLVMLDLGFEASCEMNLLELPFVLVDHTPWVKLFSGARAMLWIPALASALGIFSFTKLVFDSPYTIVVYLVVAVAGFHTILAASGETFASATEAGWLYQEAPQSLPWALYTLDFSMVYWPGVLNSLPTLFTAVFIISIINVACQLAVTPSVLPAKVMGESDFNTEMLASGRAHIFASLFGGYSCDFGNEDATVHRMFGGRYRLGMYVHVVSLVLFLGISQLSAILPFIPKFVNAAIIFIAAVEFLVAGLVDSKKVFTFSEYSMILVLCAVVILTGGEVQIAVAVGILHGFVDFVFRSSNVETLHFSDLRSSTTWSTTDSFRLNFCGLRKCIVVAKLQNLIFFATASQAADELVKKATELSDSALPHTKALIVDWSGVPGVDTAAVQEFKRVAEAYSGGGNGLVLFCGMQPHILKEFQRLGVLQAQVDAPPRIGKDRSFRTQITADAISMELISGETFTSSAPNDPLSPPLSRIGMLDAGMACQLTSSTTSESLLDVKVLTSDSLDEGLYLVERCLLRRQSVYEMHHTILRHHSGASQHFPPLARFRALLKAFVGGSKISAVLRNAVSVGAARLCSFHDGAILLAPRAWHSEILVLLAGAVVAYTEKQHIVLRHADTLHVLAEEALTQLPFGELGYHAAPSCVVLSLDVNRLRESDRYVLLEVLNSQVVQVKGTLAQETSVVA